MILSTYAHSNKASEDFCSVVKGQNFMTGRHIKTIYINDFAVEITEGEDFSHNKIYGVTVVDTKDNKHRTKLGKCCYSIAEVEKYVKDLGEI